MKTWIGQLVVFENNKKEVINAGEMHHILQITAFVTATSVTAASTEGTFYQGTPDTELDLCPESSLSSNALWKVQVWASFLICNNH